MVPVIQSPLNIGRHMPRSRHQDGWVEETGKRLRKWKGHFYVYRTDSNGQETRHHRAVILGLKASMTKWEAKARLAEIIRLAAEQPGAPIPDATQSLEWFWATRFLPLKKAKWRPATRGVVTSVMKTHVLPQLGRKPLCKLDRYDLQIHLNGLSPKYSASIVRKVRTWLKAVLSEAVEQGYLEKNPAARLDLPITREIRRRFLTMPEIGRLLAATDGADQIILRLFIECGPRPGELFACRWETLQDNLLFIREAIARADKGTAIGRTKTPASKNALPVPQSIITALQEWRQVCGHSEESDFIFASARGTPMNAGNYLKRFLQPLADRLGIPGVNYQVFRRTCATHFQRHATIKEAQAQLRHTDPSTTLGIYTQTIPESHAAAMEAFDREITGVLNTNEHEFKM
ncbi:MAG TPA: tyrosine-type recombinase/integrase [Terriglobia bacterium]|nr:tyrosine-type recombinase/integrase [Terriglobia bacterium]